ncbi:HET-domain-containing protein [Sarocladium strictum]
MKAKKRAAVPAYQYEQLPLGSIRVIYLHPGTGSADIRIDIHTCLEPPNYTAVSYVWGDNNRVYKVYASTLPSLQSNTDDRRFSRLPRKSFGYIKVTENLRKVLLGLRLEDEYRVLWIDSLCIDQDNSVEKSDQIQRMMGIYGMATNTVAYLGEYDETMKLAFEAIRILAALKDKTSKEQEAALHHLFSRRIFPRPASQWNLEHSENYTDAWAAVMAFLELPWFHRVWIIQEVVLSDRPVLFAQKTQLPWQNLVQACEIIDRSNTYIREVGFGHISIPLLLERSRLATRAALRAGLKGPLSRQDPVAEEWLLSCHYTTLQVRARGFAASDPRDHVFALLGIAKGHSNLLPAADYSTTLAEVYTRTAYAWYHNDGECSLHFLTCVNGSYDADDLPTWVPDWRRPWTIGPITAKIKTRKPKDFPYQHLKRVRFPDLSKPRLEMPLTLTVRGMQLLTVRDVEPIKGAQNCEKLRHATLINTFPEPYPTTYMTYRDAFALVLPPVGDRFLDKFGPLSEGFWSYRLRDRDRHRIRPVFGGDTANFKGVDLPLIVKFHNGHKSKPSIYIKDPSPVRGPSEPRYTQSDLYKDFPSHLWRLEPDVGENPERTRVWFITDEGLMGLANHITKPGDVVVHLFGANTPHVLRKKETQEGRTIWGYVGEAFVLGIMDGEVECEFPADRIEDFEMQ